MAEVDLGTYVCMRPKSTVTEQRNFTSLIAVSARTKPGCKREPQLGIPGDRGPTGPLAFDFVRKVPNGVLACT